MVMVQQMHSFMQIYNGLGIALGIEDPTVNKYRMNSLPLGVTGSCWLGPLEMSQWREHLGYSQSSEDIMLERNVRDARGLTAAFCVSCPLPNISELAFSVLSPGSGGMRRRGH